MSAVVCNSGPLIALSGIQRLDLLRDLFGEALISETVRDELLAGSDGSSLLLSAPWIKVSVLAPSVDPLLISLLDKGEAATITLALQVSTALVLMDEVKGRRVARDIYGLAVIGTGRLLAEAKKAGSVTRVKPLIEQMRENGYWLADKIVAEILRQAGE